MNRLCGGTGNMGCNAPKPSRDSRPAHAEAADHNTPGQWGAAPMGYNMPGDVMNAWQMYYQQQMMYGQGMSPNMAHHPGMMQGHPGMMPPGGGMVPPNHPYYGHMGQPHPGVPPAVTDGQSTPSAGASYQYPPPPQQAGAPPSYQYPPQDGSSPQQAGAPPAWAASPWGVPGAHGSWGQNPMAAWGNPTGTPSAMASWGDSGGKAWGGDAAADACSGKSLDEGRRKRSRSRSRRKVSRSSSRRRSRSRSKR